MKIKAILILTLLLHLSGCIEKAEIEKMVLKVFEDTVLRMNGQTFESRSIESEWIKLPYVKEVMGLDDEAKKTRKQDEYKTYYFCDKNEIEGNTDENDKEPEPLFRIVFIEKEIPENQDNPSKAQKKKQKKLVIDMTNGVVTSRIKIEYGAGGLSLIETVVKNAIIKFLLKVDQSIPRIGLVKDQIETGIEKILSDLQGLLGNGVTIKLTKSYKIGPFPLEQPKDLDQLNEISRTSVLSYLDAFKMNELHKRKSYNLIGYEIEAKQTEENHQGSTFDDFLDHLTVIVIDVQSRISVHLISNYFQISQEIAVQTKLSVLGAIENMLIKIFMSTIPNFIALDSSDLDPNQDSNLSRIFEDYAKTYNWKFLSSENSSKPSAIIKKFGNFEIQISWINDQVNVSDVIIDIILSQFQNFIEKQSITVPIHSRYNIIPVVTSFLENILSQYYQVIHSAFNREALQQETDHFNYLLEHQKNEEDERFASIDDKQPTIKSIQAADKLKLKALLLSERIRPFAELSEELKLKLDLSSNGPQTDSQNVYFIINRNPDSVQRKELVQNGKRQWIRATQVRMKREALFERTTKTDVLQISGDNGKEKVTETKSLISENTPSLEAKLNTRTYLEYGLDEVVQ